MSTVITRTENSWQPLQIHLSNTLSGNQAMVSKDVIRGMPTNGAESISISFGHLTQRVQWAGRLAGERQLALSPFLFHKLRLPRGQSLMVCRDQKGLRLGPILGLMTVSPFVGALPRFSRPFLLAAAKRGQFLCTFSPNQVDATGVSATWVQWKDGGYVVHRQRLPIPDVIYERIPNRTLERDPHIKSKIHLLRRFAHLRIFNQGFLNKWRVHRDLSNDPLAAPYLPETHIATRENLRRMLAKHKLVFVKPIHGTLGLGITRITRENGGYRCDASQESGNRTIWFHQIDHWFNRHLAGHGHRYLVQQGISLFQHRGGHVDFRVHMHRDGEGRWRIPAIGAKVSRRGNVTTHIRTGGHFFLSNQLLKEHFAEKSEEIMERLQQSALQIAEAISQRVSGPLGELGLDVGVDKKGKIWLFEINAKPGRTIYKQKEHRKAGMQSIYHILDYSLFLSIQNFGPKKFEVT